MKTQYSIVAPSVATMAAVQRLLTRLRASDDPGELYGGLQQLKTQRIRAQKKGDYGRALAAAGEGSLLMLEKRQTSGGADLGKEYVEVLSEVPEDTVEFDTLIKIAKSFPTDVDPAPHDERSFLRVALEAFPDVPELHLQQARLDRRLGEFKKASAAYLSARSGTEHGEMLARDWAPTGRDGSLETLALRTVLQYLCMENLKDARDVLTAVGIDENSRVYHVCDFLVLTLERDALPLFEKLTKDAYASELKGLESLVDRIAFVYYGVPEPEKGGSFMQKMMQQMMG